MNLELPLSLDNNNAFWKRAISLVLGREPKFPPRLKREFSSLVDLEDDETPWTPYSVNLFDCPLVLMTYVLKPNQRVATFRSLAATCLVSSDL
jgi:hypothetical protein